MDLSKFVPARGMIDYLVYVHQTSIKMDLSKFVPARGMIDYLV
jgi:hypothetical protein